MNAINGNWTLKDFANVANGLNDGARVHIEGDGPSQKLDGTEGDVGFGARVIKKTEEGRTQADANNIVRTSLMKALNTHYNNAIPNSVKRALVGSSLRGAHDMDGWESGGSVTSGRPLTARRIRAVMTAVRNYDAIHPEFDEDAIAAEQEKIAASKFDEVMSGCRIASISCMTDEYAEHSIGNKQLALVAHIQKGPEAKKAEMVPKFAQMLVKMAMHSNPGVIQHERKHGDRLIAALLEELRKVQLQPWMEDDDVTQLVGSLAKDSSLFLLRFNLNRHVKCEDFRQLVEDFKKQGLADYDDNALVKAEMQRAMTIALLEGIGRECYNADWQS